MDNYDKNDLTQGVIWKKLLAFFFPILLGMLFQQLYNTVDAIVVGKFVGTDALAAVGGSSAAIVSLVIGFFTGLASGATVVISQHFGARDYERLSLTVHTAVTFCLIIGAALMVLGYVLAPWSLQLVKTPENIMADSVEYLRIYFSGSIASLIFNVGSGILRAVGDSKRPLYYLVICCVLNIILDLLFVTSFNMGVAGVAWATVIALVISAVLMLISLCRTGGPHRLSFRKLGIDMSALKKTMYIGVPAGVQSMMYSLSNLIIQTAINGFGTATIAAWSAVTKFDGIYWVTSSAFGVAICAFVGQCFGAEKYDRMKKSVKVCLGMAIASAAVISSLLLIFAHPGMRIISDDPQVIELAVEMLWCFAPFYVVWSFVEVISNTLRGAGDSFWPMIIVIIGVCVLRVLWVIFVVPEWHTIRGISLAYPFTWCVTAVAMTVYYFKSDWLKKRMPNT